MIACPPALHYKQTMRKLWMAAFASLVILAGTGSFSTASPLAPTLATQLTTPGAAQDAGDAKAAWTLVAPGLELANLSHTETGTEADKVLITALRIDPARYDFCLYSVLWDSPQLLTSAEWAEQFDLTAVINACMFLPDGRSPTAYLRRGEESHRQIASNYGGFFVSGPHREGLPRAAVLDKSDEGWEDLLSQYDTVAQNMRLLSAEGQQLWPENGPQHTIAAIAQDREGKILFLHCDSQVNVHRLVRALLAQPVLDLAKAIYVEGGSQSSLTLRTPGYTHTWTGTSPADLLLGAALRFPLPTVIGIRPRAD